MKRESLRQFTENNLRSCLPTPTEEWKCEEGKGAYWHLAKGIEVRAETSGGVVKQLTVAHDPGDDRVKFIQHDGFDKVGMFWDGDTLYLFSPQTVDD